ADRRGGKILCLDLLILDRLRDNRVLRGDRDRRVSTCTHRDHEGKEGDDNRRRNTPPPNRISTCIVRHRGPTPRSRGTVLALSQVFPVSPSEVTNYRAAFGVQRWDN